MRLGGAHALKRAPEMRMPSWACIRLVVGASGMCIVPSVHIPPSKIIDALSLVYASNVPILTDYSNISNAYPTITF